MKQAFDIVFSLFALLLTAPILALVALAVKLERQGPVIIFSLIGPRPEMVDKVD